MGALLDLLPFIGKLLDRLIPDPAAKAAAQLQLLQLQQSSDFKQLDADLQVQIAQIGVNTAEANSPSLFKGGWRPYIGWACGGAFSYNFIIQPLLAWVSSAFWHVPIPPSLDWPMMSPVMMGMLGLGAMRTYERVSGVIPKGK